MTMIRHAKNLSTDTAARIDAAIRETPNFPKPGVLFRDASFAFADPDLYDDMAVGLHRMHDPMIDVRVAGLQSRGYIVAGMVAGQMALEAARTGAKPRVGFIPVRKDDGKVPPPRDRESFALEYDLAAFAIPLGLVKKGQKVLVTDDVVALGGSAKGAARLLRRQGAIIVGFTFLIELDGLGGVAAIAEEFPGVPIRSLLTYGSK
jgi:adenine phosphoribosyltransferase